MTTMEDNDISVEISKVIDDNSDKYMILDFVFWHKEKLSCKNSLQYGRALHCLFIYVNYHLDKLSITFCYGSLISGPNFKSINSLHN